MGISLFGITHAEKKKPKVHCKCRFEVSTVSINPIVDIINKNKILGYVFSFKLDYKKGTIAYTMIETNCIDEIGNSKKIVLHPNFNENSDTYLCTYLFPKTENIVYKINELVIKIVNMCNDATIFKPLISDEIIIKKEHEIPLEKQGRFVYL